MKPVSAILETAGDGWWSSEPRSVTITGLDVPHADEQREFGELRVYFDTASWDVDQLGLIYTDGRFLDQLRQLLDDQGLAGHDVEYSEQGMQGTDYVSCDVGAEFLASWPSKWLGR